MKRDVRDKFDSADSQIQQQLSSLRDTLGLSVGLDVYWSILWAEYEQSFVDKSTFVPYVVSHVVVLLDALNTKLDEDASSWADELLEHISQRQKLRLSLQVR